MKNLASRKFIYALTVVLMSFSLVLMGKVESQVFMDFATLIGGIYVVGNLGSKLIK